MRCLFLVVHSVSNNALSIHFSVSISRIMFVTVWSLCLVENSFDNFVLVWNGNSKLSHNNHLFVEQVTGNDGVVAEDGQGSLLVLAQQFAIAMAVLDTWQYFMHRYMHQNKFLYKHIHSQHHRLVVPYAFGALYNHPLEGLILDTVGGAMAFLASGMSPQTSIFFFSFATIKTVDDHCGLWLPGNLFHILFKNNSAYHDIHHQLYGTKYNFSQPFFVTWDKILGTYMPYKVEPRADGGFEAKPDKECKDN